MPLPDGTACPVPYLSRAAWGADESKRFRNGQEYWPPEFAPTRTLTVHHTAGVNNDPDPAATVRAIYHFQAIGQDWGDIGYNILIDEAGRAYEGRWSGPDPVPVFGPNPGLDGRPLMTIAGHVLGFNVSNIGVCLLGDFTSRLPTAAALNSLTAVLAGLARVGRIDVLGSTTYTSTANGTTRTARNLAGHRNWAATECPGDLFYPQLDALRETSRSWPAARQRCRDRGPGRSRHRGCPSPAEARSVRLLWTDPRRPVRRGGLPPAPVHARSATEVEPVHVHEIGWLAAGEPKKHRVYAGDRADVARDGTPALPAARIGKREAADRRIVHIVDADLDQAADATAGTRCDAGDEVDRPGWNRS